MDNIEHLVINNEEYCEDTNDTPISELVEPVNLSELLNKKSSIFEVMPELKQELDEDQTYFTKEEMLQNINLECLDLGSSEDETDNSERTYFQKLAGKMVDITEDGTVKKKVEHSGHGEVIPPEALVTIHYNMYLEYADEPFDSTYMRGFPHSFRLGKGGVIQGLDIAVSSMRKGEKSQFLLEPSVAFGKFGCEPRIPRDAKILLDVEVKDFVDSSAADAYEAMSADEKMKVDFSVVLKAAKSQHLAGNDNFQKGAIRQASIRYAKAIKLLEENRLANEEEEKVQQKFLVKLHVNLAVCFNRLKQPERACKHCQGALKIDKNSAKARFNHGKALVMLSEFSQARRELVYAQRLEPRNPAINAELQKLEDKQKRYLKTSQDMCHRMFQTNRSVAKEEKATKTRKANITSAFREQVRQNLLDFKHDPSMVRMPFSPGLTVEEELCFEEECNALGLEFKIIENLKKERRIQISKKEVSMDNENGVVEVNENK